MSDGSLTVTSVSREDRGAYTCRAYSIQGEAVHTTHLLVQGRGTFLASLSLELCRRLPGLLSHGECFSHGTVCPLGGGRGAEWDCLHVCHLPCLSHLGQLGKEHLMVWQGDRHAEPFLIFR